MFAYFILDLCIMKDYYILFPNFDIYGGILKFGVKHKPDRRQLHDLGRGQPSQ